MTKLSNLVYGHHLKLLTGSKNSDWILPHFEIKDTLIFAHDRIPKEVV
jgi:hypothetical protein